MELKDEFDPATGEPIKMKLMVKTTKDAERLKHHCHYNLKPIYSKLILPIIPLSKLGYSIKGERFKIELVALKDNDRVKYWYGAAQLCELVLPIQFYENSSLEQEDMVLLSKKEADELVSQRKSTLDGHDMVLDTVVPIGYEAKSNAMLSVDQKLLDSIAITEASALVASIELNLSHRKTATFVVISI